MKTNKKGIALIKKFEGCYLKTYKCPAGVSTIGYGHTGNVDGKKLNYNKPITITEKKAESLLKSDLKEFEKAVTNISKKYDYNFTSNEFSALVSFAFNLGAGCLHQVTAYGARSKEQIAKSMLSYNKANGKELVGLTNRRIEEKKLFLKK